MPPRVYFVPGIVLLFCAFILSLLVTISLPDLPTLDIVRCRFTTIHDALPYLLSDTRVSSLPLLTLTTLLMLFLHFVSVGSLVFGEKDPAVPLLIELTRDRGTCTYEDYPGAVRVCRNLGAFHRHNRVSAARTRSPQELVIRSLSHPNWTTLLSSDLVSLVVWSCIQLARPCLLSRPISNTDAFPLQLQW